MGMAYVPLSLLLCSLVYRTTHSFTTKPIKRCFGSSLDASPPVEEGPEKSQMQDFVSDFLRKNRMSEQEGDENKTFSHLIALPVDACHEMLLELESVQRAILYHCPVLVHSCITAAATRLPLFYVHAPRTTNPHVITKTLKPIVEKIVQDTICVADEDEDLEENQELDIIRDDSEPNPTGANGDNIKPLMVEFAGLDIEGDKNECLFTSATSDSSKRLRGMVKALSLAIESETGWATEFPGESGLSTKSEDFQARIPFMRLPENWESYLETKDVEDTWMLPSEDGGNGISPIFWGKWMDDSFGQARMREVSVYHNLAEEVEGFRLDEKTFYMPADSVPLPEANMFLKKQEVKFEAYNEERMMQAEAIEKNDKADIPLDENDLLFSKTKDRVEKIYYDDPSDVEVEYGLEENDDEREIDFLPVENTPIPIATDASRSTAISTDTESEVSAEDGLDEWTRERLKKIVDTRSNAGREKQLAAPKAKPPITENPVFQKYKEGTLSPPPTKPKAEAPLPPFPSREYCMGFWRVIGSPTGFDVEEGDSSRSENLVLRVDGTVAGGPVLDQETRQKASGGTWRLNGNTKEDTNLVIRLVIPPNKERILVMEGKLDRVSMSSDLPLASSTFGIPDLEERKARSMSEMEDMMYCNGEVWIEDAITGNNKEDIGRFSLMKLNTPTDRSQYTISVPKPVRNQD